MRYDCFPHQPHQANWLQCDAYTNLIVIRDTYFMYKDEHTTKISRDY